MYIKAGIRLRLSKDAPIKVVYNCIRIHEKFVRKNSDLHRCDILSLKTPANRAVHTRAWPS